MVYNLTLIPHTVWVVISDGTFCCNGMVLNHPTVLTKFNPGFDSNVSNRISALIVEVMHSENVSTGHLCPYLCVILDCY